MTSETKKYVILGTMGTFVFFVVIALLMYFTISNHEVQLRNSILAQQKANTVVFDNTWKIIKQQAGVTDQYKDSFKEIYTQIFSERYGTQNERAGALMSWITEQNPQFDTKLYSQLMTSIEAQRTIFTTNQKKLIDLKREHDTYLEVFPNWLFIGGRSKINIKIVTSEKTEQVFQEGQENDINLFEKK